MCEKCAGGSTDWFIIIFTSSDCKVTWTLGEILLCKIICQFSILCNKCQCYTVLNCVSKLSWTGYPKVLGEKYVKVCSRLIFSWENYWWRGAIRTLPPLYPIQVLILFPYFLASSPLDVSVARGVFLGRRFRSYGRSETELHYVVHCTLVLGCSKN